MLDIKLPSFIMDPFKYMGGLSTPMSMLFIGAVIYSIGLKNIRFDRDMLILLIGRFVITPVIVMLFLHLFNVPALLGKVFIIQSAMPVATQCAVSTRAYGGDYRYASAAVTISTIAGLLFF
jgi:predicted permease